MNPADLTSHRLHALKSSQRSPKTSSRNEPHCAGPERILTICRRDVRKLIGVAIEEGLEGDWASIEQRCTDLLGNLPRSASIKEIDLVLDGLRVLHAKITNILKSHRNFSFIGTNDAHNEHHTQSSK